MHSDKKTPLLIAMVLVASLAGAQGLLMTNGDPGAFVDISLTGGTAITGVGDDTTHSIVTTLGNTLFPPGPVRVGSNGVAIAGLASGFIDFTNNSIGGSGTVPTGLPQGGAGYLLPLWDDLMVQADAGSTTVWWQETGGVLYILWKDIGHFSSVAGQSVTFEIQVFANPAGCGAFVQFLYPDTVFGGSQSGFDQGASATVGYNGGGTLNPLNLQWSFNGSTLVPSATVLTLKFPASSLTASSPFGPGSLQLSYGASSCFAPPGTSSWVLAVTLNEGNYPNGWLFGVDIPIGELLGLISYGAPYVGEGNSFTLGPFAGLPTGLDLFAVVLGFNNEGVFSHHSNSIAYTIP